MKRRAFASTALLGATAGSALWAQTPAAAGLVPGRDFQLIEPLAPVDAATGKIEVVEFFWYSCPHCNAFEPLLQEWVKKLPKDVAFRRVPVAFRDDFVPQQRLYYALEAMGLVDKLHALVFQTIHGPGSHVTMAQATGQGPVQRNKLSTAAMIGPWIASQGVNEAQFMEHYNSFAVAAKCRRAAQLQDAYRIDGVPSMGVAGRFMTDGVMAPAYVESPDGRRTSSMHRALQVVDALVAQVRAGR